jgi:alkaline phosphatase D
MSGLREPGLGPIVGHTTDTSCRLWIRGGDPEDEGVQLHSARRTVGVLAVLQEGDRALFARDANKVVITPPPIYYFRLRREFDRTGVFDLGRYTSLESTTPSPPLVPDTMYRVAFGTLTLDDPFADDEEIPDAVIASRLPDPRVWASELIDMPESAQAVFRTFPAATAGFSPMLGFIVGSCRYPGFLWKVKEADRIFAPILRHVEAPDDGAAIRQILMIGDQIYADMFNRLVPVGRAATYAEFQERYLSAFGSPNMRRLLRRVPHFMILDDHEIEDNWLQDRLRKEAKHQLFNVAISAYRSYQWIHGPHPFGSRPDMPTGNRLYYAYDCANYPFFVLDTRTQRTRGPRSDDLNDNHLLGRPAFEGDEPDQLTRLLTWLTRMQAERGNVPKFVVTASVFVPNDINERWGSGPVPEDIARLDVSDSWPAYPATRRAILDTIVAGPVQNVVFLSGDIHCSTIAAMRFTQQGQALPMRAYSITSSAFYWPFPFADGDPASYVHDSTAPGQEDSFPCSQGVTMDYQAAWFTQEDNFCRVTVDRASHSVTAVFYDQKGVEIPFRPQPLPRTLTLVPW